MMPGGFDFVLVSAADGPAATLPQGAGIVVLDTAVTPELEAEGVARDVIRLIQGARRDADLHVSDRIHVTMTASAEVAAAVRAHGDMVSSETLAGSLQVVEAGADEPTVSVQRVEQ